MLHRTATEIVPAFRSREEEATVRDLIADALRAHKGSYRPGNYDAVEVALPPEQTR